MSERMASYSGTRGLVAAWLVWLGALLLAISPAVPAHEAVATLTADSPSVDLMTYLEVLEDPSQALTVEDVARPAVAGRFLHADHGGILAGFSGSAFWLRLTLRTEPALTQPLLLVVGYPLLDRIDFYQPLPDGGFRVQTGGDAVPFAARTFALRLPTFEVAPTRGENQVLYLRVASTGPLQVPLRLWQKDAFLADFETAQIWVGAFTGAMAVCTGLALLLYVVMRDRLFLLFTGFLAGYTLLQAVLSGLAFQYLWPEATVWASRAPPVLVALTGLFITAFSREFLDTRERLRRLDRVLRLAYPFGVAVAATAFVDIGVAIRLSVVYGLGVCLMAIVGGLLLASRGQRSAGYFAAALIAFVLGMVTASVTYLGEVSYSALTANAMQVGSVLLIVLTAIAVSDRIRSLLRSRAHAAESAQRYLTSLNQELERLVSDRTAALERSNAELKQLASRDGLTGLLNHRATVEELERLLKSAFRYGEPLAVAMVDIDHFKDINDRFGHQVGDGVLTALSQVFASRVRAADVCGRYGGEEFLLLLPKATAATGGELAERLRQAIEELHLPALAGAVVTASFGVAAVDPVGPSVSVDAVIHRADDALYRAKRDGRNRVHVDAPPHGPRLEAVRHSAS
jgi:diguanylate cyclase (GGDEF)-like protein